MDFDSPKVYGDTSISDGLSIIVTLHPPLDSLKLLVCL